MDKIKVGYFTAEKFPEPVGSFLLDQIVSLIDCGIELKIFITGVKEKTLNNKEKIKKYDLESITNYIKIPKNKFIRAVKAIPLFAKHPIATIRCLNTKKYGRMGLTLLPLFIYNHLLKSKERFDVMHFQFGQIGIIGAYLRDLGIKSKTVVSFHGGDATRYPRLHGLRSYDYLFDSVDLITCNSNFIRKKIESLGAHSSKIVIHPTGLEVAKFVRKCPKHENKVVTLGRLIEEKGQHHVIRAISRVARRFPEVEYVIAGSGPFKEHLESLVKRLNLEKNVKILGYVAEEKIGKILSEANVFACCSTKGKSDSAEGQGLVIQEAGLMKLPCIGTRLGGIPEGIIDGKTGFVVSEGDVVAIANKIEEFMKNPGLSDKMGLEARKLVLEKYDSKLLAEKMKKYYTGLVEKV